MYLVALQSMIIRFLLNTTYTRCTEHKKKIKLVLTGKFHPHYIEFIVLEGDMHATGKEKSSPFSSRTI